MLFFIRHSFTIENYSSKKWIQKKCHNYYSHLLPIMNYLKCCKPDPDGLKNFCVNAVLLFLTIAIFLSQFSWVGIRDTIDRFTLVATTYPIDFCGCIMIWGSLAVATTTQINNEPHGVVLVGLYFSLVLVFHSVLFPDPASHLFRSMWFIFSGNCLPEVQDTLCICTV